MATAGWTGFSLSGSTAPAFPTTLEHRLENAEGGKVKLIAKISQSNVDENFKMRVPIYLEFDGKIRRLGAVSVFGNSTTDELQVTLDKRPSKVMLCAYEDVLCTIENR